MISHIYHHHLAFSSEPEKIPENRNPYFDAPYYFLSILSLFTYLFVVCLSARFEAKIGRKLTDRGGRFTRKHYVRAGRHHFKNDNDVMLHK